MRIAHVSRRTPAGCSMVVDSTLRTRCTAARWFAAFVPAGKCIWTVVVPRTFRPVASDERISSIRVKTIAPGSMVAVCTALSVHSTLGVGARILTLSVDASFCWWTVWIWSASDWKGKLRLRGLHNSKFFESAEWQLTLVTLALCAAGKSISARTRGSVQQNSTFCVPCACVRVFSAWV